MTDWTNVLLAFLHDPPDKAIDIRRHESRTRRYLEVALDWKPSDVEAHGGHADHVASAIERLPMPRGDDSSRRVSLQDDGFGPLRPCHPLSAEKGAFRLESCRLQEEQLRAVVQEICSGLPGAEQPARYLALWRLLPDRLIGLEPAYAVLPADTRTPDHTIWQHADITAGLTPPGDGNRAAFLSFSLGPVQSFIASARTVRDLWTGSMILSWLTFQAMTPVLEQLGPTALIYPSLRGTPLLDQWLRRDIGLNTPELDASKSKLTSPCLPNRFVAIVPWAADGEPARRLARECEARVAKRWKELCGRVHKRLSMAIHAKLEPELAEGWDHWWNHQLKGFFDIRTSLLPWKDCDDRCLADLLTGCESFSEAFPAAMAVRRLAESLPSEHAPGRYAQSTAGQWQSRLDLSARLLESSKSARHIPPSTSITLGQEVPGKCSLLGTVEQMGPSAFDSSAAFWKGFERRISIDGVRLRNNERLSAPALVKRFALPAFFQEELEQSSSPGFRWQDTATIAAACWFPKAVAAGITKLVPDQLRMEGSSWSGQWLHGELERSEGEDLDEEKCPPEVRKWILEARQNPKVGPPPAYYAVLVMDGDNLGEWLRGALSPRVQDVMHPKMVAYYRGLAGRTASNGSSERERGGTIMDGLAAQRPVGPALHAAISEALANFALHFVPEIVSRHQGQLIYAGGDDVLALLPTETALRCAVELQSTYRRAWAEDAGGRPRLLMGNRATLSAGLAIVHYKEDLRFALEQGRAAEREAKAKGRDTLQLAACRRSGEHASAICPWDFVPVVAGWVDAFQQGATDRWAYRIRADLETLAELDPTIMEAELRRHVDRTESPTRKLLGNGEAEKAGATLVNAFRTYRQAKSGSEGVEQVGPHQAPQSRFRGSGDAFAQFITLCQSASFIARGRDQ